MALSVLDRVWPRLLWLRGARIGRGARIHPSAIIHADRIEIGDDTYIGPGTRITASRVRLGAQCHLAAGVTMTAGELDVGDNAVFFEGARIHGLGRVTLGAHAKLGREATIKASTIDIGMELWMNARAEIGGGGWRTRESVFRAGDRCHIGRSSHVNVAQPVTLGHDTAIGMDCTLATHAHWQPITDGFPHAIGPIVLGSNVAIYSRAIVSPGVTIHDGGTVAAGSVVLSDVPERGLVGGVPARLIRIQPPPESPSALMLDVLDRFARLYHPSATPELDGTSLRLLLPHLDHEIVLADRRPTFRAARGVLLTFEAGTRARTRASVCVFDLAERVLSGFTSDVTEQLRNHVFSAGLRFRYDGYRRHPLRHSTLLDLGIE